MQVDFRLDAILAAPQAPQHGILDAGAAELQFVASLDRALGRPDVERFDQHRRAVRPCKARPRGRAAPALPGPRFSPQRLRVANRVAKEARIVIARIAHLDFLLGKAFSILTRPQIPKVPAPSEDPPRQ
ncbi:MAG: hypothetical protein AB7V24_02625 [Steroidobacteraceae bacterium]